MRSRLLTAPALLLAIGVDALVGCNCDEVIGQVPVPDAVLVFGEQNAPPLDNLVIGLAPSLLGQAVTTSFSIENRGNQALNVSDVVVAGDPVLCPTPSAGFVVTTPAQGPAFTRATVVSRGDAATVTVQFTATSGQPVCAVVEVRSDDPDSPVLKARITGQGDAPQLCADRGIVDFGTLTVGDRAEEVVTLTSCGTRPFSLQGGTLNAQFPDPFELVSPTTVPSRSLAVGDTVPLTVAFDPEAVGTFSGPTSGIIDLQTDLDGAFRIELVGIARLPPSCRLQVVPNVVNFGQVGEGRSSTQTVFVRNIGELPCTFQSAEIVGGAPFSRALVDLSAGEVLGPQQSGSLTVTYAPTSNAGRQTDTLRVISDDPVNGTIDVPLEGTSVEVPPCFLEAEPTAVNFGFQTLRRSNELEVRLRNVGTETCIVSAADITAGAPEFSIIEPPFTAIGDQLPPFLRDLFPFGSIVPVNETVAFIVSFRPEQAGLRTGNYRFTYKEQGLFTEEQLIDVPASGTGIEPCIEVVPADIDFGAVTQGSTADREASIRNCGGSDLIIRGVNLRAGSHRDFRIQAAPALPLTLLPGATAPVTVRAAPTAAGVAADGSAMYGALNVMSDADTRVVNLRANTTGACVDGLVCSPRTLEFGDVLMGEDLVRSVVCSNPTAAPVDIAPTIAAPFELVSAPTSVPANGQAVLRIRFTPQNTSQAQQTLQVGANDCQGAAIGVVVRGRGADDELPQCPTQQVFLPQTKWDWSRASAQTAQSSNQVWVTPLVSRLGDTNNDGHVTRDDMPRVVFISFDRARSPSPLTSQENVNDPIPSELRALDGATGQEVFTVTNPEYAVQSAETPAIADVDGDGRVEIIAQKFILLPGVETLPGGPKINGKFARGFLIAFNFDGSFKWVSDEWTRRAEEIEDGGAPAIGDVDGDGFAEIATGDHLFDHNGRLLWRGDKAKIGSTGHGPTSVLADVDGVPGLELVAGTRVFRSNGTILWERTDLEDGHPAVADLDGNGTNEVVIRGRELHVLNGRTGASLSTPLQPATRPEMGRACEAAGPPPEGEDDPCGIIPTNLAILNFDGGNDLEIFSSNQQLLTGYKFAGGAMNEIFREDIFDGTGASGPAGFDFEGNGTEEVVYSDESTLRSWQSPGTKTFEGSRASVTIFEYSTIADIDNDGAAEMLVASNAPFFPSPTGGVRAYVNTSVPWANARSIWNQHAYVESIISELGVPLFESTPTALPGFRNARARCIPR
jgi:hypothetical protein